MRETRRAGRDEGVLKLLDELFGVGRHGLLLPGSQSKEGPAGQADRQQET